MTGGASAVPPSYRLRIPDEFLTSATVDKEVKPLPCCRCCWGCGGYGGTKVRLPGRRTLRERSRWSLCWGRCERHWHIVCLLPRYRCPSLPPSHLPWTYPSPRLSHPPGHYCWRCCVSMLFYPNSTAIYIIILRWSGTFLSLSLSLSLSFSFFLFSCYLDLACMRYSEVASAGTVMSSQL